MSNWRINKYRLFKIFRKKPHPRLFVLGAGFSMPAGFPDADQLSSEIFSYAKQKYGEEDCVLFSDREDFIEFKRACGEDDDGFNFEEFMEWQDVKNFLGFERGEQWSDEGTASQLIVRKAIGSILYERGKNFFNSQDEEVLKLYEDFVDQLKPTDIIVTLNYDLILEYFLEKKSVQYILYPSMFRPEDDVSSKLQILKLHGSIDWISSRGFDEMYPDGSSEGAFAERYAAFPNNKIAIDAELLLSHDTESTLKKVLKINNLDHFYSNYFEESPIILSPSSYKFINILDIKDLFIKLTMIGHIFSEIIIIGFSMPEHDKYLKQFLYEISKDFDRSLWTMPKGGMLASTQPWLIINKPKNSSEDNNLRQNYKFLSRTVDIDWDMNGFSHKTINILIKRYRKRLVPWFKNFHKYRLWKERIKTSEN